jgi:hypothetical protein
MAMLFSYGVTPVYYDEWEIRYDLGHVRELPGQIPD